MMRPRTSTRLRRSAVLLSVLALLGLGATAEAAVTPTPQPPTYDYNTSAAGTQAPISPLVTPSDFRSVRLYQVSIPVLVSLPDLQAIMPPGFTAVATPAGSQTGTINFLYIVDQRFYETTPNQTFGPFTGVLLVASAVNNNLSPARTESVFPAFEVSSSVAELNASFGPGSARLASVDLGIAEHLGNITFGFNIVDSAIGFNVAASATSSVNINNRSTSDPVAQPFRALAGRTPNRSFIASSQSDTLTVPKASANVAFQSPDGLLHLPAGNVKIVGVGDNITFSRNVEFVVKFQAS